MSLPPTTETRSPRRSRSSQKASAAELSFSQSEFHASTAWKEEMPSYSQGGPKGLGWQTLTTAPASAAARIVRSTAAACGSRNSHQRSVPQAFQWPP